MQVWTPPQVIGGMAACTHLLSSGLHSIVYSHNVLTVGFGIAPNQLARAD